MLRNALTLAILRISGPALAAALLLSSPALAAEPAGSRVPVNGMEMYYEVFGEGDPLIVLRGSYMNIPTMGAIVGTLAEGGRIPR